MSRILVVDDENNIRLMIRLALQSAGYDIETASDGIEALEKWDDGSRFDLVLLDHRMPSMKGTDVLRAMKERDPAAKVILITAFGTIDVAHEAMSAGATDFLRKPFTTEVLRDAVRATLDGKRATFDTKQAPSPSKAGALLFINGFRIENSEEVAPQVMDEIRQMFTVRDPNGESHLCMVVLPRYFRALVQAHADRDVLDNRFWLWLGEEALANYLWQNAELPSQGTLQLEELSSNLRRWMDAVLTP